MDGFVKTWARLVLVLSALMLLGLNKQAWAASPTFSPSKSPIVPPPTQSPTPPTLSPTNHPTHTPTSSPVSVSQFVKVPMSVDVSVVVKSQITEAFTLEHLGGSPLRTINAVMTNDPSAFSSAIVTLKQRQSQADIIQNNPFSFTSSLDVDVFVNVQNMDASISSHSVPLNFQFSIAGDSQTPVMSATISVNITVLTAMVFPEIMTYEIPDGSVQNESTLNPRPEIQVFNALCTSAISYNIIPASCNPNQPDPIGLPQWLGFERMNLIQGDYSTIVAGRGLPDTLKFWFDFTDNLDEELGYDGKAVTHQACLRLNVTLSTYFVSIEKRVAISVTTVRPCPPGTFSSTGEDQNGCQPCALGQYQPNRASTTCFNCPESFPNTLKTGATFEAQCVAASGSIEVNGQRLNCPIGANCTSPGLTVQNLPLVPGYWRPGPDSLEIFRCPRSAYCIGGTFRDETITDATTRRVLDESDLPNNGSALCRQYHEGVMCSKCVDGTIKRTASKVCSVCTKEAYFNDRLRMSGILIGLVFLVIFLMSAFCWHSKNQLEIRSVESRNILLAAKGEDDREGNPLQPAKPPPSNFFVRFFDTIDVTVQLKIIIGLFQVIGGMSIAFEDALPDFFSNITGFLALLTFDVVTVFDFGCALTDQSHYATLLVSTLVPVGLILAVIITDRVLRRTRFKDRPDIQREVDVINYTIILLILFLVYPSVSSVILKTFNCKTIGNATVIGSDLATECYTPRYESFRIYSIVSTVVYVVGIPVYYAALLYRERRKINLDPTGFATKKELVKFRDGQESIAYVRFLWRPYRPETFWFEVYELIRKLGQTSILVYVAPGTSIQMCFQLAITAFSVVVLHIFTPYQRLGNQILALVSQWVIFMITFISLLIKVESIVMAVRAQVSIEVPESYDVNILNAVLFILLVIAPALAVLDIGNQLLENQLYRRIFNCMTCCCPRCVKQSRVWRSMGDFFDSSRNLPKVGDKQETFTDLVHIYSAKELARRADIAVKVRDEEITELHEKQTDAQKAVEDLHKKVAELEALVERRRLNSMASSQQGGNMSSRFLAMGTSFRAPTLGSGASFRTTFLNALPFGRSKEVSKETIKEQPINE